MLGGQIGTELDIGELPLGRILGNFLLQKFDGIAIRNTSKGLIDNIVQLLLQPLVIKLAKEGQILVALLQSLANSIFQHRLGIVHGRCQIGECHFGLDHVEFGKMSRGLRVLSAEGRAKGIDIPKGAGMRLTTKLTRYGKIGWLGKKILGIIDAIGCLAVFILGHRQLADVVQIQSGDTEHLTGTLAVRGSDERSLNVNKALILEEGVD
mmetsp:Transcript_3212/g.9216  ORF Transcript_3212/g.9216 Transcript_3212/m.9216 type:complete len:209 (-) Transcript_3212:841-1467(-)